MEYPISLYYDTEVSDVKTLDLCRGDDDYRKVHVVDDGHRRLVIKFFPTRSVTGAELRAGFS